MGKRKKLGRLGPNGKQQRIAARIRKDILFGVYKPGDKLPARVDIEDEYDCGPITVQNAFNKLKDDGSITINGNKGTFVSDNPPSLSTYAIVFPFEPEQLVKDISMYSVLAHLSQDKSVTKGYNFKIYANINGHKDEEDYVRLLDAVVSESLAGVLFATPPCDIIGSDLYKQLENRAYLPKVAIMSEQKKYPAFSSIYSPDEDLVSKMFDFFQKRNIKRLGVLNSLTSIDASVPHEKEIFLEASARGIELEKYNFQSRSARYASRSNELVHLMLSCSKSKRLQALWITSDTLVESATKGIIESGLKVPEDLIVVNHCNFPENPKSCVETSRYGLNVSTFIDTALEIMKNHKKSGNKICSREIPMEYYFD